MSRPPQGPSPADIALHDQTDSLLDELCKMVAAHRPHCEIPEYCLGGEATEKSLDFAQRSHINVRALVMVSVLKLAKEKMKNHD